MKCEHCGKEVTQLVVLCPFCYTYEGIETISGHGSYKCHICNRHFLVLGDGTWETRVWDKEEKYWKTIEKGKIDYIKVPYEWRSWY